MKALLIGHEPPCNLGYTYVCQGDHDDVVVGSLTYSQLLHFDLEPALAALATGKKVLIYEPGMPEVKGNRGMAAALAARRRELKNWGVIFTDGGQKKLITAQEARNLLAAGKQPVAGAILTPLAKAILEGKE